MKNLIKPCVMLFSLGLLAGCTEASRKAWADPQQWQAAANMQAQEEQRQQAAQQQQQAAYQQDLENRQRQEMIDLQRQQLQQPQTYTITDEYGRRKTITVQPQQNTLNPYSNPSKYRR